MNTQVLAVDLGASSGRVILGCLENPTGSAQDKKITLQEVHRFYNGIASQNGKDCWDIEGLLSEIKKGIDKALAQGIEPKCLAIDGWGVDFVLLNQEGEALGEFVSYRDARTQGMMEKVFAQNMSRHELYQRTGLQFLPFNTIYQLKALLEENPSYLAQAQTLLFIPDYLNYRLSGVKHCEYTNASTSGLLDCQTKTWDQTILKQLDIPEHWLLAVQMPNQIIGEYQVKGQSIPLASVPSHDTASAVAGAPLAGQHVAYLSSGTWSLMGIESFKPLINPQTTELEITHEGGAEGRYRILKNIMGLWLVQEVRKAHPEYSFADLVALAEQEEPFKCLINPDDPRFLNPQDMQAEIIAACRESATQVPENLGQVVRCIYDSLALRYAKTFAMLQSIAPQTLTELHIIGGGANNKFLNQLTADVCQIKVCANPTEASALGNLVGQFIALGEIKDINEGRKILRQSFEIDTYQPKNISHLSQVVSRFDALLSK